jgi:uncharacterized membrane protein YvbJ
MGWDTLVCSSCAHPVAEANCPACRALREDFQRQQRGTSRQLLVALAAVMLMLAVLAVLQH